MIICAKQKLIYLAPPKTGTGSVVALLKNPHYRGVAQDNSAGYHNTIWEERFRDWFIFMTTRHPYTRAVSFWKFVCRQIKANPRDGRVSTRPNTEYWAQSYNRKLPNFIEFWDVFSDKTTQLTLWRASWHLEQIPRPVDKIVYQENLNQEILAIPIFQGRSMPSHRHHAAPAAKQPWHAHYTPDLIARVHEYWGQDFAAFGYNPDFEACVRGEFFTDPSSS